MQREEEPISQFCCLIRLDSYTDLAECLTCEAMTWKEGKKGKRRKFHFFADETGCTVHPDPPYENGVIARPATVDCHAVNMNTEF